MKREYDFSQAERGKFYRPCAKMRIPVYLDEQSFAFVENIARKKHKDLSFVVNRMIHRDMKSVEVAG